MTKSRIAGCEKDIATRLEPPTEQGKISPMVVEGTTYTDREKAGVAILTACKNYQTSDEPYHMGTYRGFDILLTYSARDTAFQAFLKGEQTYTTLLGQDVRGNSIRMDNALLGIEDRLIYQNTRLSEIQEQAVQAKTELEKPFPQEVELNEKIQRLANLDALLNMEKSTEKDQETPEIEPSKPQGKPSVMEALKRPCVHGEPRQNQGRNEVER